MSKPSAKSPSNAKPVTGRKVVAPAPMPKAVAKKAPPVTTVAKKSPPKPAAPVAPVKKAVVAPAKTVVSTHKPVLASNLKAAATKKPAAAPVPKKAEPVRAPVAPPPSVKAAPAPLAKAGKTSPVTQAAPAAPINRFSERFSPPKPPARGYPEPMEMLKPAIKADPKLVNAWKSKSAKDLTEPELLAMPEAEYMNDKQHEFFRLRLQGLKDDLLSNAGETTEHLREDTSIVPDPADRATIEEEHALELRTRDRERKLLKKIQQSLGRIDSNDYGFCDETGEPIGLGRLLARPTATLSLEAQQRREMKQKMFGD